MKGFWHTGEVNVQKEEKISGLGFKQTSQSKQGQNNFIQPNTFIFCIYLRVSCTVQPSFFSFLQIDSCLYCKMN